MIIISISKTTYLEFFKFFSTFYICYFFPSFFTSFIFQIKVWCGNVIRPPDYLQTYELSSTYLSYYEFFKDSRFIEGFWLTLRYKAPYKTYVLSILFFYHRRTCFERTSFILALGNRYTHIYSAFQETFSCNIRFWNQLFSEVFLERCLSSNGLDGRLNRSLTSNNQLDVYSGPIHFLWVCFCYWSYSCLQRGDGDLFNLRAPVISLKLAGRELVCLFTFIHSCTMSVMIHT